MNKRIKLFLATVAALTVPFAVSALSQVPKEIVIGASFPQTGPLAAFGAYEKWAFERVVKEVNAKGGLKLAKLGATLPVKLVTYDDESAPEKAAQNVERLITKDGVVALLGGGTPPLSISDAVVADREGIPFVTHAPIRAMLGANQAGWKWTYIIFFDELKMTDQQFLTMNTVKSNKQVALFTDNEQDGVVMGGLWNEKAPKFGYKIVYHAKFPVGTTDYGDLIRKAQSANAEIVICQMIPPDSIALRKQMDALKYKPKAIFFEKGGEPVDFVNALGNLAQGTMVAGYWHPSLKSPGAADLAKNFEAETKLPYGQLTAVSETAIRILLDGIVRAGNLEPAAINEAIGKTNKSYVAGRIKFTEGPGARAATIPIFMTQWQNGKAQIVYPKSLQTAPIIFPLP